MQREIPVTKLPNSFKVRFVHCVKRSNDFRTTHEQAFAVVFIDKFFLVSNEVFKCNVMDIFFSHDANIHSVIKNSNHFFSSEFCSLAFFSWSSFIASQNAQLRSVGVIWSCDFSVVGGGDGLLYSTPYKVSTVAPARNKRTAALYLCRLPFLDFLHPHRLIVCESSLTSLQSPSKSSPVSQRILSTSMM